MPTACDEGGRAPSSSQASTPCRDLTFGAHWSLREPSVILPRRRVRARPAPDSDPVRRHGPERGSTGGGGRPRSFPSGPPRAKPAAGRLGGSRRAGEAGTPLSVGIASDADAARRLSARSPPRLPPQHDDFVRIPLFLVAGGLGRGGQSPHRRRMKSRGSLDSEPWPRHALGSTVLDGSGATSSGLTSSAV